MSTDRDDDRPDDQPATYPWPPAVMRLQQAAYYTGLSPSLVKKAAQNDPTFPKQVQLTARRVGFRRADLDAWVASREASTILPPEGSGYGRRGKDGAT